MDRLIGTRRWVAALAALTGTTALSIDMSLPAQPTLVAVFGVTTDVAQLTLGLFLAGYSVGQLAFGNLSDALGRRGMLLAGLALYTVAGVACAASPSIEVLLAARVAQGFGAAAAPVIARAMVRDTQPAASAARMLSTIMMVVALAPMLAPLLGGALLQSVGWRAIFGALTVIGVVFAIVSLRLPETLPPERRAASVGFGARLASFARFFRTPGTRVPTALVCLSFAGQFAYISDSPFVLIGGFGASETAFAIYFGITALALMAGATLGRHLLATTPPSRVLGIGAATLCAGGILVATGVRVEALGAAGLVAPMVVYFVGIGLTGPSATAIAMEPVPAIAGTASALIGALQMLAGAVAGYATTRIGGADPRMLGDVVAGVGALAAILAALARRSRSRRN